MKVWAPAPVGGLEPSMTAGVSFQPSNPARRGTTHFIGLSGITPVREQELGQPKPARGVHNPAAALGLDPVTVDHPTRKALGQAIEGLSIDARRELLALIWIGQGDYGAAELDRAFANTASTTDLSVDRFTSEAELHDVLMKSLYELKLT